MCQITVINTKDPKITEFIAKAALAINPLDGGHLHGAGITDGNTIVKAANRLDIVERLDEIDFSRPIIIHVRKATKGEIVDENAHPFRVGKFIGVHNGNFVFRDQNMNAVKDKTDSEMFYEMVDSSDERYITDKINKALENVYPHSKMALAFFYEEDGPLVVRHNKPLNMVIILRGDEIVGTVINTQRDSLERMASLMTFLFGEELEFIGPDLITEDIVFRVYPDYIEQAEEGKSIKFPQRTYITTYGSKHYNVSLYIPQGSNVKYTDIVRHILFRSMTNHGRKKRYKFGLKDYDITTALDFFLKNEYYVSNYSGRPFNDLVPNKPLADVKVFYNTSAELFKDMGMLNYIWASGGAALPSPRIIFSINDWEYLRNVLAYMIVGGAAMANSIYSGSVTFTDRDKERFFRMAENGVQTLGDYIIRDVRADDLLDKVYKIINDVLENKASTWKHRVILRIYAAWVYTIDNTRRR